MLLLLRVVVVLGQLRKQNSSAVVVLAAVAPASSCPSTLLPSPGHCSILCLVCSSYLVGPAARNEIVYSTVICT